MFLTRKKSVHRFEKECELSQKKMPETISVSGIYPNLRMFFFELVGTDDEIFRDAPEVLGIFDDKHFVSVFLVDFV